MSHPLRLGDRVVLNMPDKKLQQSADVWAERQGGRHMGVVVQLMTTGDVRVWDTAENDWWCCDQRHVARLP